MVSRSWFVWLAVGIGFGGVVGSWFDPCIFVAWYVLGLGVGKCCNKGGRGDIVATYGVIKLIFVATFKNFP